MKTKLKKQLIQLLPLEQLSTLSDGELEQEIQALELQNYSSWLLPQLVSQLATWKIAGCGKTTVTLNCVNAWQQGLWKLTRVKRGLLIKNQIREPQYAKLTPLILLAFKRSYSRSYESWRNFPGLEWLLEPDLFAAVQAAPEFDRDTLLQCRQQGLAIKTGPKAGTSRPAHSTWQLYGIQDTVLGSLPKLQQTILTQCWLAHPQIRCETMILDPNNWDFQPEPLIQELFTG